MMRPLFPISVAAVLSFFLVAMMFLTGSSSAFEFQHDYDKDQCKTAVKQCTKGSSTWYKCPISCSEYFEREGSMAEEREDPEQFYQLEVTKSKGDTYSLEDNEGYITIFAVLPLLPGMAQYYYDAIEHMSHVYKYTLVPMILPYRTDRANLALIQPVKIAKSMLLKTMSTSDETNNDALNYLLSRPVAAGNNQDLELAKDRPTIFLISHNGMFIERLVAPTMETMERRVKVYEQAMSMEPKDL